MIALGGPKLKLTYQDVVIAVDYVSMIALGGPKLKQRSYSPRQMRPASFNDSTGWA